VPRGEPCDQICEIRALGRQTIVRKADIYLSHIERIAAERSGLASTDDMFFACLLMRKRLLQENPHQAPIS